jgi:hypothetical protein
VQSLPDAEDIYQATRRTRCVNSSMQLALALHYYELPQGAVSDNFRSKRHE